MSLILEALKKLDREKAFIRKVTTNIADEILKTDPVHPRKRFPLYFGAVLLTVCVTATLTYVVIANLGFLGKTAPPAATALPRTSRHIDSPSPSQIPVREAHEGMSSLSSKDQNITESKTPQEAEPSPDSKARIVKQPGHRVASVPPLREPERGDQGRITFPSSKDQNIAESKGPLGAESSSGPKPSATKQPAQRGEIPPPPRQPARQTQERVLLPSAKDQDFADSKKASPLPVASPSSLRLTGIVWSEDPAVRCAVINGAIITEGAVIQGARVVEILPNRVRLIQEGRPFEIQLF